MRDIRILSFTEKGFALSKRLGDLLPARFERCNHPHSLQEWTADAFHTADALLFIGATGIAVRAIAPYLNDKASDPAVIVVDELGRFIIPIVSGHLGGANALAREVASLLNGTAVITTATDINGIFSVDDWARNQGLYICNPTNIKKISARLLDGVIIKLHSEWPIAGTPPEGVQLTDSDKCDILVSLRPTSNAVLNLVPRSLVIGIGCRKGVSADQIEAAFKATMERAGLPQQSVSLAASIDRKAQEAGLLRFCGKHRLTLVTFSSDELSMVNGLYTASDFVQSVTGVDNVCERSAVLACGGELLIKKMVFSHVTMALALRPVQLSWR